MSSTLTHQFREQLACLSDEFIIQWLPAPDYVAVVSCQHPSSGLRAFIALHDLGLGPAIGGVRVFPYRSEKEAIFDVMQLARAMTYKTAVADLGIGGGKTCILLDPKKGLTKEMAHAFGRFIDAFQGNYFAGKDVGMTQTLLEEIRKTTPYVVGLSYDKSSGDPSKFTAWGIVRGIQASLKYLGKSTDLSEITVAIQGLGAVGFCLADQLFLAGANLIVSDIDLEKASLCEKMFGAKVVRVDQILEQKCDVLAPCALGGVITPKNIPYLRTKIIAGGANNILSRIEDARTLQEKGILYAPDYVINAGGLLNVLVELEEKKYCAIKARKYIGTIPSTLAAIYTFAETKNTSTADAAKALADYRLQYKIGKRTSKLQIPS